jgi:hypothetical protein
MYTLLRSNKKELPTMAEVEEGFQGNISRPTKTTSISNEIPPPFILLWMSRKSLELIFPVDKLLKNVVSQAIP